MPLTLAKKVPVRAEHTGNASEDRAQILARQASQSHEITKSAVKALANYVSGDLAADASTTGASLVDLMSVTITSTLASGFLIAEFCCGFNKPTIAATARFVVNVDGVDIRGTDFTVDTVGGAGNVNILVRVPAKAGAHVVKVRWFTNSGTVRINAKSSPLNEFATLLVREAF